MTITRRKPIPLVPYFRGPEHRIEDSVVFSPEDIWGSVGAFVNDSFGECRTKGVEVNPRTDTVVIHGGYDMDTILTEDAINSDSICRQLGLHYYPNGHYLGQK